MLSDHEQRQLAEIDALAGRPDPEIEALAAPYTSDRC